MEYLEPYEIFLRKAESDLNIIKLIQSARDYNIDYEIDYEIYMFHLQQATEKVIKALLCKKDIIFHRTHDIESLFNLLEKNDIFLNVDKEKLFDLTDFAVEGRYNFLSDLVEFDYSDEVISLYNEIKNIIVTK